MKDYTALIVDLEKSRSYTPEVRNSIQNYILSVMRALNELYENSLAKEVEFSAGDEVQGLFFSPESAYLYLRMLSMLVFPVKVRAGIGIGEWNIKIENESTTAQDGPAYYNARYAINNAKDTSGYPVLIYSGKAEDLFLNAVINASIVLTTNHSEYQNELMLLSELLYPVDYGQAFDFNKIGNIFKLVKSKNKSDYYRYYKNNTRKNPFDKIKVMDFESDPIDAENNDSNFYVSSGKIRGMSTKLSEILNISRQSVEKTIKTANIYEVRNLAIAALKYMDRYFIG